MINGFEVDYARFNALKTVATTTPSAFEHIRFGDLHITRDQTRAESYYNRILGLTEASTAGLNDALSWIHDGTEPESSVRVDVGAQNNVGDTLRHLGFQNIDAPMWCGMTSAYTPVPTPSDGLASSTAIGW